MHFLYYTYYINIITACAIPYMYIDFEIFTVVLSGGTADSDFRGFLIQGRVVTDGTTPAGTFTKNGDDQQTVCTDAVSVN